MQQLPNKRQHRSTSRYQSGTASGSGAGAPRSLSAFSLQSTLNGHQDYTVSTSKQPNFGEGAIVKTPKKPATGERNFNKKYSINNNNSTSETEAESREEVQHNLQDNSEEFKQFIGGDAVETHCDISNIVKENDNIVTKIAQLRTLLTEAQTTTRPPSISLLRLTNPNSNPVLLPNLLSFASDLRTTKTNVTPTITTAFARAENTFGGYLNIESVLLQRLQLTQHLLNLATAETLNNGFNRRLSTETNEEEEEEVTPIVSENSCFGVRRKLLISQMVHENKPESMEHEVVVNSTSLEDVAQSELRENRAQSIQSLHSVETPTPDTDTSPSFDELQQRLESSNRNIQNMQEQQQQLLRLQNAAKQHLSEMEHLRQQAGTLSFGANQEGGSKTTDGAPDYESIDQVHSDMATLVGRMKNLTTFIQNQNELSNLLGDDGPEILAEQEALQQKLESLRAQRDDMRTLVSELQDINRNAERRVGAARDSKEESEEKQMRTAAERGAEHDESQANTNKKTNTNTKTNNPERVVPVCYTRNVPIKLANGGVVQRMVNGGAAEDEDDDNIDAEEKAATALLIQKKVADIETMRKQLGRLKEMMETVNTIEASTTPGLNGDIGCTPPRELRSQSRSTGSSRASFDRDRTPVSVVAAHHLIHNTNRGGGGGGCEEVDDAFLTRKMRMLNDVTSDLRTQAASLQAERDRIKALKEEIILRKQQAAAAVQLGEDALKRNSLTPTPTPRKRELDTPSPPLTSTLNTHTIDPLKTEYEAKKREFEILCQRLQQDESKAPTQKQQSPANSGSNAKTLQNRDTVSEADDEADGEEDINDSDFPTNASSTARQYLAAPQQQSTPAQQHRAAVKAAVNAHTLATSNLAATTKAHQQNQSQRLIKEDSFETNLTSSTGERRHSTLANATNTTHDGGSLEAGSVQSGSSAFSMPPPMPSMGACSSWPPMPPLPNTWNPQFYYGFGATAPPHPPTASQPSSAATASAQNAGAQFTPIGLLPPSVVNSECICSGANSATNAPIVTGPTPVASSTHTAAQLSADPVLLHQFVQTQQMLISSVCQCNQMLWHQQREIDALNNTIHVLQERLHALNGCNINSSVPITDLPYSIRAESVPPPTLTAGAASLPNNLYLGSTNRAQSEQSSLFLAEMNSGARNSAFTNYQHHHNQQQHHHSQQQQQYQQHQHRGSVATASNSYNFTSETHSNIATASNTNTGLYGQLNNAPTQPPPQNQVPSHYNNEVQQSPPLQGGNATGPGPIFMNHHNNAIHQNNANLRTQNHYANNLQQQQQLPHQQQQQQHSHSNINIGGGNTLNNQVPPGNRANNYWDNFRSYSRQNLLSTNSNKSNEEQQQQNHQQNQQQSQPHYLQQHELEQLEAPTHYRSQPQPQPQPQPQHQSQPQPHLRGTTVLPTTAALTTGNLQQLQRQQQQHQQQQQQQQRSTQTQTQPQSQHMYRSMSENNSNSCNNLNFERNASNNNYSRTQQRSHINRYHQQQHQQNLGHTNSTFTNQNNLYQSWLPQHAGGDDATGPTINLCTGANKYDDEDNGDIEIYDAYNIIDSDLVTPYAYLNNSIYGNANSSNMLRNMNVNFGNSPHYQRSKLLTKPNCRVTAEAMEQHNLNRARQQQQQQEQQQQQQRQQQRMFSQQQLALRAQQQLDQSTLQPITNMGAFKTACYLDLLPATVSEAVATAEARMRNSERVDMLLRTVTTDDNDAMRAGENVTTYDPQFLSTHTNRNGLLLDTNEIGNNTPNIDNENEELNGNLNVMMHQNNANNNDEDVERQKDEEEDDTTSEEIKRNLLVNALKNDKFTTKFYESIKEDVFRRLERILLERESAEGNCQNGVVCNGLSTGNATSDNEILGAVGGAATQRDPTRKFNLNARMCNQQQQQRLQQYQQQQQQQFHQNYPKFNSAPQAAPLHFSAAGAVQSKQDIDNEQAAEDDQYLLPSSNAAAAAANNFQANGIDENTEDDEFGANNADTESNKADNEDAAAAAADAAATINTANIECMPDVVQTIESEQPEEDDVPYKPYTNNNIHRANSNNNNNNSVAAGDAYLVSVGVGRAEGNIANWRKNMLGHAEPNSKGTTKTATSNIAQKRKNQSDSTADNSGAGGDADVIPIASNANNSASTNLRSTYYTDLIAYIITRIRNQTHTNTQINDTLLVEISKLTASAVQNFAPTLVNYKSLNATSPHISPKKFYMKIKKLSVPRQRDGFLQWYQNYLENLLPGARLEAETRREQARNMSGGAGTGAGAGGGSGGTGAIPKVSLEMQRIADKLENNNHNQLQQQISSSCNDNKDNNDADLAEADQNSANSSSNTIEMFDAALDKAACAQQQEQKPVNDIAVRENEHENNENPDDDDDTATATDKAMCASINIEEQYADCENGGAAGGLIVACASTATDNIIKTFVQQNDSLLQLVNDDATSAGASGYTSASSQNSSHI